MSLRPIVRPIWRSRRLFRITPSLSRCTSTHHSPPFPTIQTCPSPSCSCSPMPAMPEGLEIDHAKPINGTMAAYVEQVLICTGKDDWMSRIEEENSGDNLAADIKELLGRGGMYSDPYHNVSITNASFPSSIPERSEVQTTSAYLFPSFKYVPYLPRVSFDAVQALVKGYILPKTLHPAHSSLSPIHKDRLTRNEDQGKFLPGVEDVKDIVVLICGHGGRDIRCGILGPVLRDEFKQKMPAHGIEVLNGPLSAGNWHKEIEETSKTHKVSKTARVGLISHIGGHKFAGNVIIYIPPNSKMADGSIHALAGCGIWYGRVKPRFVEGIVKETILDGKIIEDLFRGGIRQGGEILRL